MLLKRGSFLDQNYTVGPSLSFHTFMLQGAHIIARVCKHCVCVSVGERMYGITTLIQPLPFDLSCVLCCTSCSLADFRDMSIFAWLCLCHNMFKWALGSGYPLRVFLVPFITSYYFPYKIKYHGTVKVISLHFDTYHSTCWN